MDYFCHDHFSSYAPKRPHASLFPIRPGVSFARLAAATALLVTLASGTLEAQTRLQSAQERTPPAGATTTFSGGPSDRQKVSCNSTHCYCHSANGLECSTMAMAACAGDLEPYGIGGMKRCRKKNH